MVGIVSFYQLLFDIWIEGKFFISDNYSVDRIYGIRMGYRGFYDKNYRPFLELNPCTVEGIHQEGGLKYI